MVKNYFIFYLFLKTSYLRYFVAMSKRREPRANDGELYDTVLCIATCRDTKCLTIPNLTVLCTAENDVLAEQHKYNEASCSDLFSRCYPNNRVHHDTEEE